MSRTTQEEFCNIINERYNNQFEVVSEYVPKGHVDVKCNICNSIINVNCDQAKYDYIVCRNCKAQNQIDEHNGVGEYKLISNYKGTQFPISVCHKCGTKIDFKRATTATYNKIKCPLCDKYSKSLTHEGFLTKLHNKYGDEYEVLSQYESMTKNITVRHNVCGEVFDIAPDSLLNSSCGCRKCINNSMRTSHDEFVNNVHNILPDIQIVSEYKGRNYTVTCKCLKCGDEFSKKARSLLDGHGCKKCTSIGRSSNNLWKTHPNIAKYLKNPDDGYKYQYSTDERLEFICPNCGSIVNKQPYLILDKNERFVCQVCSDGVSIPEKIVASVLSQLGIDYIPQLSKKDFQWCGKYRYDFYIPLLNIIIEVHGLQHYQGTYRFKSYEDIHQNDLNKMNLAIKNGIADYIVIDAKKSDIEYLKNSILNSNLNKYYLLDNIDWNLCVNACATSLKVIACDYWKSGMFLKQIADVMNMNFTTISKYLREMTSYGLCDYSTKESRKRICDYKRINGITSKHHSSNRKLWGRINGKVKNLDTGIIYDSLSDANKAINKNENSQQIYKCCLGCNETAYGYHWEFVA